MKMNKIPSVFILICFSWLIALAGALAAGYLLVFKWSGFKSVIYGLIIISGSFLCAALIRVFGNIAQMIFDLNARISILEHINCDIKDINQSSHQVKIFFEKIERHLDLHK